MSDAARRRLGVDSGLVVGDVEPGTPAAESGIRPGDVIVTANNRSVAQPPDLAEEWAKARKENRPLLVRINRDGQSLFFAIS
jgi:serine protease Do